MFLLDKECLNLARWWPTRFCLLKFGNAVFAFPHPFVFARRGNLPLLNHEEVPVHEPVREGGLYEFRIS